MDEEVTRILVAKKENDKHIAAHACKDWPAPPDPEVRSYLYLVSNSLKA